MNDFEQRLCARVPFQAPLHILTHRGVLEAETCDLSRTGVGIRVALPEFEPSSFPGLAETAMAVHERLGRAFHVDINPEVLGSLLRKRTVVVRLGERIDADGCIVLGCRFKVPLDETEMVSLGVPLPPAQDDEDEWVPRADVPAPHFRQPTLKEPIPAPRDKVYEIEPPDIEDPELQQELADTVMPHGDGESDPFTRMQVVGGGGAGWRAHVTGSESEAPPLIGRVDKVTPDGIVLRVFCDDEHLREIHEAQDVVTAILAFTGIFGQSLNLKVQDGATHVWSGPTVLTEMALAAEVGDPVYLNLRYGRHLRPAELRSLGLERIETA
ncbi:MAG: PilZ domain-containing protein [Planctomycetota bacterium]|nr:PilZ domain-containing protein [Planctomycetota bacterium]